MDAQRESFGLPPATTPEPKASASPVDSDTDTRATAGGAKVDVSEEGVELGIIFRIERT